MSKSLGNFYHAARSAGARATRRKRCAICWRRCRIARQLNFTFDGLKSAATAIDRLRNFKLRLETDKYPEGVERSVGGAHRQAAAGIRRGLDDDLNTAEALAAVFEYRPRRQHRHGCGRISRRQRRRARSNSWSVSIPSSTCCSPPSPPTAIADAEVEALVAERNAAKKAKNFARADQIRERAARAGHYPGRHQRGRALEEEIVR